MTIATIKVRQSVNRPEYSEFDFLVLPELTSLLLSRSDTPFQPSGEYFNNSVITTAIFPMYSHPHCKPGHN